MRRSRLTFLVAFWFVAVVNTQCYYPGGDLAKDQFPCDKHAYTTLCCPMGWTCFSNKLCVATDPSVLSSAVLLGMAMRGTCTNPLWNNTACGDFCLDDPVRQNGGAVVPCGYDRWCCQPLSQSGECNCNTGVGTFQVVNGVAETIIGVVGLQHTSTGAIIQPSSVSSSSSGSASPDTTTSSPGSSFSATNSTSSTSPFATTFVTLTSFSSTQPSSSITTSTAPPSQSTTSGDPTATNNTIATVSTTETTAFKAGISVISVIGFIGLIGFLLWLIFRWRRWRAGRRRY